MEELILKNFNSEYLEYQKNEVTKRKPYLVEILESSEAFVEIHKAKGEGYYFLINDKPLTSKINPVKEALRIYEVYKEKIEKSKILFLFGIGNFYLFDIIFKNKKDQIFIIIEEEEKLIHFYWKNFELFHLFLLTPNCHIFTKKNIDRLFHYLNGLNFDSIKSYLILNSNLSNKLNSFYREIETRIHLLFKSNISSLLTQFEFEKLWFTNIFCNLHFLKKDSPFLFLIYYKKLFENLPFVIIGAGPSLRYSKEVLLQLKDKAFLFATDASLKPLLRMGIIPDAIHILDAQIHTFFHLRNENLKNIIIFSDIVVHPFLIRKIKPLGWIFSSTTKYKLSPEGRIIQEELYGMNLIKSLFGDIGSIQSGGSVSTSAFEIARYLGAKTIFLIGQDLAWTNRQLHSVHTHHYEKWYSEINRTKSLELINEVLFQKRIKERIPAIQKNYTYGDAVLNLYRFWFEETALELKEKVKIYNLTYDGAYIQNLEKFDQISLSNLPKKKKDYQDFFKRNFENYRWGIQNFDLTKKMTKKIIYLIDKFDLINQNLSKKNFYEEFLDLQNEYLDLKVFSNKVEIYIKRNQNKLTEERIIDLRYKNILSNLKKFIKFYISFNTSFTHSEVD